MAASPRSGGPATPAVIHQLGQALSAILSNAQAARRFLASESPNVAEARMAVIDVVAQGKRAARIFRRLEIRAREAESASGK